MRQFTLQDVDNSTKYRRVYADRSELAERLTDWQKRGLQQTATGYGRKLNTGLMIHFEGKLRRLYSTCYSNAASVWFTFKGETVYVS